MGKKITRIDPTMHSLSTMEKIPLLKKKRVAAYARVPTETDEQQNSYEAQIDYYTTLIKSNPECALP